MKFASAGLLAALASLLAFAIPFGISSIQFEDIAGASGISFVLDNSVTPEKHQPETMIGGVAAFDYNNDGLIDLYFVNGATLPGLDKSSSRFWNRLYKNNGNGTFSDVTAAARVQGKGYGMGAAAADYNNDGCIDLYIASVNANQLFRNNCDGTFTDVTALAGVAGIHPTLGKLFSIAAGWFDYDNDGLLDLYIVNYVRWNPAHEPVCKAGETRAYCSPNAYQGEPGMLFHNNGNGTFTDVSERSGIGKWIGKGMGIAFADYDADGFVDVFVSNDTYRNFLFHNLRNGKFAEVGVTAGVAYNDNGKSIAGMGADFRDYNNDGKPDLFVAAMIGDTFPLFRNLGGAFQDETMSSGLTRVTRQLTAWSTGVYDLDNDGWKDLFASTGSVLDNSESVERLPSKLPNLMLRNQADGTFAPVPFHQPPRAHRGAVFADLDNDGRVDIVVACLNAGPEIWMNRTTASNHWLDIALEGTLSNRQGLGAKVELTPVDGPVQFNVATTSVGYASSSDARVHFGLGSAALVRRLDIIWPSGRRQRLNDVKPDQLLRVREP